MSKGIYCHVANKMFVSGFSYFIYHHWLCSLASVIVIDRQNLVCLKFSLLILYFVDYVYEAFAIEMLVSY